MQSLIPRSGGGKSQLRSEILSYFPKKYKTYAEPFCGAMWVLLGEERPGIVEAANDCDGRLMNFWQVVKNAPEKLCERIFEHPKMTREIFEQCKKISSDAQADAISAAAAYFLILRNSYMSNAESFSAGRNAELPEKPLSKRFFAVSERLNKVNIYCKDFEEIIEKYDDKDTLFYLDPPYYRCTKSMRHSFGLTDFSRLFDVLRKIKGKFLISFDDCGFARRNLREFEIIEIERRNGFNPAKSENRGGIYYELLFKNF